MLYNVIHTSFIHPCSFAIVSSQKVTTPECHRLQKAHARRGCSLVQSCHWTNPSTNAAQGQKRTCQHMDKKKQKHTTLQSSCSRKSMRVDEIWIDMVYRKETFMTKTKIEPISFSQRNEALASFHH